MTGPIQPPKESVPTDQVKAVSGHFRQSTEPSTELYWCRGHRVQDTEFISVLKLPVEDYSLLPSKSEVCLGLPGAS